MSPLGEGAGNCAVGAVGTWSHVSPLWTLQCRRFRTGPDVAAARADRGENRDPGRRRKGSLDGGAAIREHLPPPRRSRKPKRRSSSRSTKGGPRRRDTIQLVVVVDQEAGLGEPAAPRQQFPGDVDRPLGSRLFGDEVRGRDGRPSPTSGSRCPGLAPRSPRPWRTRPAGAVVQFWSALLFDPGHMQTLDGLPWAPPLKCTPFRPDTGASQRA